jgi:hypothetical protein
MLHPGKTDWWIGGLLALIAAALVVGAGTLIGVAVVAGQYAALAPGTVLLLVGGMLVWILRGTNSEITETSLIIRSGPFRWTVPLDAIEEVVPQTHWYAGPALEWNFGLAVKGIRIRYRKKSGGLTWPIRIAPRDRAAFLLELAERLPGLEVKDDGSLRRPADPNVMG